MDLEAIRDFIAHDSPQYGLKPMPASKKRVEFAICVANEGYDDLEVWKVYRVMPDTKAAEVGCLRVIDES
jgi:hypothetical protein